MDVVENNLRAAMITDSDDQADDRSDDEDGSCLWTLTQSDSNGRCARALTASHVTASLSIAWLGFFFISRSDCGHLPNKVI